MSTTMERPTVTSWPTRIPLVEEEKAPEPEPLRLPPEKTAVEREAERLDRLFPGWHKRVNIGTLNLFSGRNCVLGQAAYSKIGPFKFRRGYVYGIDRVNEDWYARGEGMEQFPGNQYCSNNDRLAWVLEIRKRRAA